MLCGALLRNYIATKLRAPARSVCLNAAGRPGSERLPPMFAIQVLFFIFFIFYPPLPVGTQVVGHAL